MHGSVNSVNILLVMSASLTRIIQDFANPKIAKHLQFYPEKTDGPISEVWQAERWKEFGPSERTPMYAHGLKHFFINEVAQLDTGSFVLPLTWIKWNGTLCADCLDVTVSDVCVRLSDNELIGSRLAKICSGSGYWDLRQEVSRLNCLNIIILMFSKCMKDPLCDQQVRLHSSVTLSALISKPKQLVEPSQSLICQIFFEPLLRMRSFM